MTKDNSGSAFPIQGMNWINGQSVQAVQSAGVSKRELAAMFAMMGMISHYGAKDEEGCAGASTRYADALLEELGKSE